MDEQRDFMAGRGCVDQVFVVRQVVEKSTEKDKEAYMTFVDLEKAYDNVSREKHGQSKSEMFHVHKGVRKGCTLSPWMLNVFMDKVAREAKQDKWSEAVYWRTGSPPV